MNIFDKLGLVDTPPHQKEPVEAHDAFWASWQAWEQLGVPSEVLEEVVRGEGRSAAIATWNGRKCTDAGMGICFYQ